MLLSDILLANNHLYLLYKEIFSLINNYGH